MSFSLASFRRRDRNAEIETSGQTERRGAGEDAAHSTTTAQTQTPQGRRQLRQAQTGGHRDGRTAGLTATILLGNKR